MSLTAVKLQISRFLTSSEPEVLCLHGEWGTGKTYTWQQCMQTAQEQGQLALERYAYVSLFGINSLEELRLAIFQQTINSEDVAKGADESTLRNNIQKLVATPGRKLLPEWRATPILRNWEPAIRSLAFLSTKDQLICLDDFERKGDALNPRDVLGLVSELKEQKNCKVALILNPGSFKNADGENKVDPSVCTRGGLIEVNLRDVYPSL